MISLPTAASTTGTIAPLEPWWLAGWSKHISPSSFGRAAMCPRSEAMPHSNYHSAYSGRGTVAHKFLADCLEHGRDRALGMTEDPADIDWLSAIDIERLPAFHPDKYSPEVAIAYDPRTRTARELGRNIDRDAARKLAEDHELVGIIDVAGMSEDYVDVQDYKTGWGYVDPAEVNWQTRSYALFAARCYGKTRAFNSIVRVRDNGGTYFDTAEMDELDLLAHEERMLEMLTVRDHVRNTTREGKWQQLPAFAEGKHCRYCPAMNFCPAKTFPLKALGVENPTALPELDPATAAAAWRKLKLAKIALYRFEAILKEYARLNPVPLGDDEVLGEKEVLKSTIVPEQTRKVLVQQYGDLGNAICGAAEEKKLTVTKKRFKAALKKLLLPTLSPEHQKITHLEKSVTQLLRENGALSTVVTRQVTEFIPRAAAPDELGGDDAHEEEAA